jgi:hypothetical protein
MNYYIVVEGKCGERIVYPKWVYQIAKSLTRVVYVNEIVNDNYFLISGNGYPQYYRIIDSAIDDMIAYPIIDKLVIAVDAENLSYDEKLNEIKEHIHTKIAAERVSIIIQYPSLEAWALGNTVVCRKNPEDALLKKYLRIYDVRELDPEELPGLEEEHLNRCQFAYKYLRRMLYDRYPRMTYSKANPTVIAHEKYFSRIKNRFLETGHIKSFSKFIETFSS